MNDPEKVFQLYDSLLKDFPEECKKAQSNIDRTLTIAYRKKKDYVNFEYYLSKKQHDYAFQAEQLNEIAWELATANLELTAAKAYSERALVQMDSLSKAEKPQYYNSKEKWDEFWNKTTGNYYDTYATIFYKSGKIQTAAEQQKIAVRLTSGKNTYINEQLVRYLIESNQPKEALARAEEFKIAQQGTVKIDSMYTVAYVAIHGSTKGLDAAKEKMEVQIKDAPDFTLKTLDGKSVTLSSLKGKIVILDLWATWCGPCLASFSGMQKAIDALKDRNDVCFYFINTFEHMGPEARLQKIEQTILNKKVNFNILLDEQTGTDYTVANLYSVTNIPSKIIIDKKGKIYSTLVGFNGNDEELVKELKSIVETLK
jgi:thiol-disulfide isomerase/thioredoxin